MVDAESLFREFENLKCCNQCILISVLVIIALAIARKFGVFRRLNLRCCGSPDLRKFSNLPIPKLRKDLTLDDKWFRYYERTMNTSNPEVLKSCLFFYVDSFMEGKLYALIDECSYEEIKQKFTFSYQI